MLFFLVAFVLFGLLLISALSSRKGRKKGFEDTKWLPGMYRVKDIMTLVIQ
jgi:hypothetical protein